MVAEAMTEAARGEDTRGGTVTSQVVSERVQVPKAHSLTGRSMTRAISGGHGSGFGRIEVPVVWTRSALTGSDKIAAVISRSCIGDRRMGDIVLCRCVGLRSKSQGRPLSVRSMHLDFRSYE